MKIAVFDTHRYDQAALTAANETAGHQLTFFETRLTETRWIWPRASMPYARS